MEIKETLVITFLIVIIIILIFSKISVSLSGSGDSGSNNIYASKNQNMPINMASIPTPTYNVNDLISNDVKKQLNSLHNQFYFNNCRK